jgi:hypothetical protein
VRKTLFFSGTQIQGQREEGARDGKMREERERVERERAKQYSTSRNISPLRKTKRQEKGKKSMEGDNCILLLFWLTGVCTQGFTFVKSCCRTWAMPSALFALFFR